MKVKKIAAAVLALLMAVSVVPTAWAATETPEGQKTPDFVFYRSRPKDVFDGEIDIRKSGSGTTTGVILKSDAILHISDFDDTAAHFDSLYTTGDVLLDVERESGTGQMTAGMAVYDRLELVKGTGSVTLTVKDNKTLKGVQGTEYSLYLGGELQQDGLKSDQNGKIKVSNLVAGSYELRQTRAAAGYQQTSVPVPFSIGGIELSGGETQIKTTANRTIRAGSDEVLIAGSYSPDILLKVNNESQLGTVNVTFEGYGTKLDDDGNLNFGRSVKRSFSSVKDAQDAINEAKNSGAVCGSVKVTYSLNGSEDKSTCGFTQYVGADKPTEETPAPTPEPTKKPNGNGSSGNGSGNGGGIVDPATPTPAPSPSATPSPFGTITVFANCKNRPISGIMFELMGKTTAGTGVDKTYRTDAEGMITIDKVPEGSYNLTVVETDETAIYQIPYDERVQIGSGANSYLKIDFELLTGTISGTVTDPDGEPLKNVTVGLYQAENQNQTEDLSGRVKSQEEVEDIAAKTYYNAANSESLTRSEEDGSFVFTNIDIGKYELMPIVSGGYFTPDVPVSYSVTGKQDAPAEVRVECTRLSILYLGKHGGKLTERTVSLNDEENSSWKTANEPQAIKGLVPGSYTLTVQDEEGKEKIAPYTFTVEETPEIQKITVETNAVKGEQDIPKEKGVENKEEASNQADILWFIIPAAAVGVIGVAAIIAWRMRKKKPEKGGIK